MLIQWWPSSDTRQNWWNRMPPLVSIHPPDPSLSPPSCHIYHKFRPSYFKGSLFSIPRSSINTKGSSVNRNGEKGRTSSIRYSPLGLEKITVLRCVCALFCNYSSPFPDIRCPASFTTQKAVFVGSQVVSSHFFQKISTVPFSAWYFFPVIVLRFS